MAAAILMMLLAALCGAQETVPAKNVLTNRDIETLADAGFGEDFVIDTIRAGRPEFDVTADGLAELKKHGVKEEILRAMQSAGSKTTGAARQEFGGAGSVEPIRVFVEVNANPSGRLQPYWRTAEVAEALAKNCPALVVTNRRESAAFLVVLDRAAGKLLHPASARLAIFNRTGDTVYGSSERALGKAVRGFCSSAQSLARTNGEESLPGSRFSAR